MAKETTSLTKKSQDKFRNQFNRTYISTGDFEEAEAYLLQFEPEWNGNLKLNDTIKRSLISSAIIAYARPFSGNKDHPMATSQPPLNPREVLLGDEKFIQLHDKIINLRKKVIAHSDFDGKPVHEKKKLEGGFQVRAEHFDVLSEGIDVNCFHGLCRQMQKYCGRKLHELNENF